MQRELTENELIEDGWIMGTVSTGWPNDYDFPVCTVDEYKTMTDEELDLALIQAMWWSGQLKVYIRGRAELK